MKHLLGLKSSSDSQQLNSRLIYHPDVFEFYTSQKNFSKEGLRRLEEAIQEVQVQATKRIVLHHPMTFENEYLEMVVPEATFPRTYAFLQESTEALLDLADSYDTKVLVHGSYELRNPATVDYYGSLEAANDYLFRELEKWTRLGKGHIFFENGISPLFSFGEPDYDKAILEAGFPLAYDVSHAFIHLAGDNAALVQSLETLKPNIQHYHLVDSMGISHDSLPLGQGKIDWKKVYQHLNPSASSIYEIDLKDVTNPYEQLASHQYSLDLED
ncbi:sugar phosphate isomerase/epimerase [Streptococcus sp. HF-1907]|uniref:TIM barrel protein n=1 Tax=Streptococcus sp. HF-1907 TaxID=2785793 RepID=UPI00189D267A|nr:TIM barrel protein [Streptococcus sp. HF-1907]MBF7093968.1 sugar phosphate isomerase/epimerase [Streptococcus sp. HF-1907]